MKITTFPLTLLLGIGTIGILIEASGLEAPDSVAISQKAEASSEFPFIWDGHSAKPTAWSDGQTLADVVFPAQCVLAGVRDASVVDLGGRSSAMDREEYFWIPDSLWRERSAKAWNEYPRDRRQRRIALESEEVYLDLSDPHVKVILDGWVVNGRGDFIRGMD